MTRQDVIKVLGTLLDAGYFKSLTSDEMTKRVDAWYGIFEHEDGEEVRKAAFDFIRTDQTGYDPKPGQILTLVKKTKALSMPRKSAEEAWSELDKVLGQIHWESVKDTFDALPKITREIVGNPGSLRAMAAMDEIDLYRFEKPRFVATYKRLMDEEDQRESMGLPLRWTDELDDDKGASLADQQNILKIAYDRYKAERGQKHE